MYKVAGCRYYWDGDVVIYVQVAIELFATRSPCRCNRENEILRLEGKLLVVGGVKFDYNRWRDWSDIEVRLGLFYAGRVDN